MTINHSDAARLAREAIVAHLSAEFRLPNGDMLYPAVWAVDARDREHRIAAAYLELLDLLQSLRREHDRYPSVPQCAVVSAGSSLDPNPTCTCGASKFNARIDAALGAKA